MERNYDFRKEMLQFHRPGLRRGNDLPKINELQIDDGFSIVYLACSGEVLETAAKDLQDYLRISMDVSVALCPVAAVPAELKGCILIGTKEQLQSKWEHEEIPASYEITVSENAVIVCGFDARGCAQGIYRLEDQMTSVHAPYIKKETVHYAPAFSPRMVHSGFGEEDYPDAHLSAIAHAGMDAILLMVTGVNRTIIGEHDFNELIRRAAKYGLDVYIYSKIATWKHPDDEDALEFYENAFGEIFRQCPGFKGIILVGESVEFPSKDPRVAPFKHSQNKIDGIPTGKHSPGWYPCCDYPQWLRMLQRVIYPHKPDADIVLWTYNWGGQPEEARLALIDSLPEGITLMATFEMFNLRQLDDILTRPVDYTISFPEAGPYFISEAKRAKERGIRLYTQANSAGLTWDYGVIPYDPFPEKWIQRYESMLDAREKYGLCGVMESHHFGFYPSFISKIEKLMFTLPRPSSDEVLRTMAAELYGPENADEALEAWHILSEAHSYYPCVNEDQYGPFRIGPAYPLVLELDAALPSDPNAMFGSRICATNYALSSAYRVGWLSTQAVGLRQLRIDTEMRCLEKMRAMQAQARAKLEAIAEKLDGLQEKDCLRLVNMIRFIENTATTAIHAKQWAKRRWKLLCSTDSRELLQCVEEMQQIAEAEIENARATIPVVEADSRLGWEPSMEYVGDAEHIRWKIRQVTYVLEKELPDHRRVIEKFCK